MNKTSLLLLGLALAAFQLAASPLAEELENALKAAPSFEQAMLVITDYRERISKLEDLRVLQNYWMRVDPASCQDWFLGRYRLHPDNPEYEYLWLRGQTDSAAQLLGGRSLIGRAPDFYWGYRLFSNTYSQILQDPAALDSLRADIIAQLESDRTLLLNGLRKWPRDDYLRLALFHHYASQGETDLAETQLLNLYDPAAIEANFRHVFEFIETSGRIRPFEVLFPKVVSRVIERGELASADSLKYYQLYYLEALKKTRGWAKMRDYFKLYPQLETSDETLATRILMHLGLDDPETALNLLEGALAAGVIPYPEASANEDYAPLKELPRYAEVMDLAKKNWMQGKAERKAGILAQKISRPAPLWELPDPEGNPVRLKDLRGRIVILDFWALWCNPCLQTLAKLEAWLEQNGADDLAVISVSVWENPSEYEAAAAYFASHGYQISLLFGDSEVPRAYGFSAIPWLCAIDQDGNIAFTLSGDSPVLEETLDVWVEELRR